MGAPRADKQAAVAAAYAEGRRLVDLLRAGGDPSVTAIGEWDAQHLAAHLAAGVSLMPAYARGEGHPEHETASRAAFNDRALTSHLDRSFDEIAAICEKNASEALDVISATEGDPEIPWMGLSIPQSSLAAILLGEVMVHGYDLARAWGKPWPLEAEHCRLMIMGLLPSLPHFVARDAAAGFAGTYELRVRGGETFRFIFTDGSLEVAEGPGPADARMSLDPVAYLMVGYGRWGQWGQIARGRMLAWGRKPWLSMKLANLLENP